METITRNDFLNKHGREVESKKKRPKLKLLKGGRKSGRSSLSDALESLHSNKSDIRESELMAIRSN